MTSDNAQGANSQWFKDRLQWLAYLIIIGAGLLAFGQNFDHAFHLDSSYGILQNRYLRSLAHIPRYFVDPLTLTSYRSNADYRPVLQVSYALNYAISGYRTWSWHLFQLLLHIWCAIWLYKLIAIVLHAGRFHLEQEGSGPVDSMSSAGEMAIPAFVVGLLFVIHPTASGVVNYLWARSSLLTAAWLLPSFFCFTRAWQRERSPTAAVVLYALALFTKVEAIAALAVYPLLALVVDSQEGQRTASRLRSYLGQPTLRRWLPFLFVAVGYVLIRALVMPDFAVTMRAEQDASHYGYFCTQLTAWWYYVYRWFVPLNLIADYTNYPRFDSLWQPTVLLALSGWLVVLACALALWKRFPHYTFFIASAWVSFLPHSSILPLSEMVNEHRPYLPMALASVVWLAPIVSLLYRFKGAEPLNRSSARAIFLRRSLFGGLLLLLSVALLRLTWTRNAVFRTSESYWGDVVQKSPSGRSLVNYGLTFLGRGDYAQARDYFARGLQKAPNWFIAQINMGIALERLGEWGRAKQHFDRAVALEQHTGLAHRYRGEARLRHGDVAGAVIDFDAALAKTTDRCPLYQLMAKAYRQKGDAPAAERYDDQCPVGHR